LKSSEPKNITAKEFEKRRNTKNKIIYNNIDTFLNVCTSLTNFPLLIEETNRGSDKPNNRIFAE
tara:strand:+ start:3731 stop:3922 length:192 start_codon:yes stop_codon:yes gene_type:complete